MSKFEVFSVTDLNEIKNTDTIPESDYAVVGRDNKLIQFKYINEEDVTRVPYKVKPGIWAIEKMRGSFLLLETSFNKDEILKDLIKTKDVVDRVDCFFSNLDAYKEFGIEVPKRNILLFGPAGSGKTTGLTEVIRKYASDGKTAVIVWHTDKFEAYEVKDFVKSFEYEGVEKLLIIIEDLGGIELDKHKMRSDSSLLSLLDNQEKIFKIPVMMIATTNHIEVFMGNLTNRPGRFDDKIKVGFPSKEERNRLLAFFTKNAATEEELAEIELTKFNEFSPAHIREIVVRARLHKKTVLASMREIQGEIELYKKDFEERMGKMGF